MPAPTNKHIFSAIGLIVFCLLNNSCKKENINDCNCSESNNYNKICKEYKYEGDKALGFIDYSYNSAGFVSKKSFFNEKKHLVKTETMQYNNHNQITSIESRNKKNENTSTISFYYNSFDSLELKVIDYMNNNIEKVNYEYDSLRRKTVTSLSKNNVFQSKIISLYNDGQLYKNITYNGDDKITEISFYLSYKNKITQETKYNENMDYIGKIVYVLNDNNVNTAIQEYNKDNQLVNRTNYEYINGKLANLGYYNKDGFLLTASKFEYFKK